MVLVENEKAFASITAEKGMRNGFTEFSAEEGVMFLPQVANVKEFYRDRESTSSLLTWEPIYAEIASSGDLGYTIGPWEWRSGAEVDSAAASGHYITIWKQQPDSIWKFILDIGVSHEPHDGAPPPLATQVLDKPMQTDTSKLSLAIEELIQLEIDFSRATADNIAEAYASVGAEDIRFFRDGDKPIQGLTAVTAVLQTVAAHLDWEATVVNASRYGDLGYSYGVSKLTNGNVVKEFSYTHIWRMGAEAGWQLALDIHIPLPVDTSKAP